MSKAAAFALVLLVLPAAAWAANELIVTELMYNSPGTDVEWIELFNVTDSPLDLTGWHIVDDDATHFLLPLSGTLAAGEVLVVVGDEALFTAQYPDVTNYLPDYFFQTNGGAAEDTSWSLGNGDDGVQIFDDTGTLVFTMLYEDGGDWPSECDGDGPSLVLITNAIADFTVGSAWAAGADWGTPGYVAQTVATDETTFDSVKALFR